MRGLAYEDARQGGRPAEHFCRYLKKDAQTEQQAVLNGDLQVADLEEISLVVARALLVRQHLHPHNERVSILINPESMVCRRVSHTCV